MQSGKMDHPFLGPGPPGARAFVTAGRQLPAHRSVARPPPSCKGIRSRDGLDYIIRAPQRRLRHGTRVGIQDILDKSAKSRTTKQSLRRGGYNRHCDAARLAAGEERRKRAPWAGCARRTGTRRRASTVECHWRLGLGAGFVHCRSATDRVCEHCAAVLHWFWQPIRRPRCLPRIGLPAPPKSTVLASAAPLPNHVDLSGQNLIANSWSVGLLF
jgi:hypothetical protein